MTKYREILRLHSLNFSQQTIVDSCSVSKKTVNSVLRIAKGKNPWPLEDNQTDKVLAEILFSEKGKHTESSTKRMPDYAYICNELLCHGVRKKLLWTEFMEYCRINGDEPLMHSQFCDYIQQVEQKHHATMHLNRKPEEKDECR